MPPLGLEMFAGLDMADPAGAYLHQFNCGLGFDNFGCGMFTMFHQLTGNNWNDIMNDVRPFCYAGLRSLATLFGQLPFLPGALIGSPFGLSNQLPFTLCG